MTDSPNYSEGDKPKQAIQSIVQVSRPFFTSTEISYLHSKTIRDQDKAAFATVKHHVFQHLYQVVKVMKFPIRVLNTSMNFYQRFYLFNKFEYEETNGDPFLVAITCLFLACKQEDCIKKLRDLQAASNKLRELEVKVLDLEVQRKEILLLEFKLLQVIKFDFLNGSPLNLPSVDHLVSKFSKLLNLGYKLNFTNWLIAYDMISTPLVLMVPPHCIALAIIIVSLNLKPSEIAIKNEAGLEDTNLEGILESIDCYKDFRCREALVNEAILYILDYYIHVMNLSILLEYIPAVDSETGKEQIFKFMELKSRFNDLIKINENSVRKRGLEGDDYLGVWDYNFAAKGSLRFMMANKRGRFEKELLANPLSAGPLSNVPLTGALTH